MEKSMELTKSITEIEMDLKRCGIRIFRQAMNGEQCAKMFEQLEKRDSNIKELINRHQYSTGNDRYYTMTNKLSCLGVPTPLHLYRSPIKSDDASYVFSFEQSPPRRGMKR